MASREEIIAKIRKCLALGKSSNEHEAATALRMAQKLMESHGLEDADVADAEISEAIGRSASGNNPPTWEARLALSISGAFGCEEIYRPWTGWTFIGAGPASEIARYAFEVLYRQVKRARAVHIKARLSRCGRANKMRRADLFCIGWVTTAVQLLHKLAVTPEQESAIAGYIERRYETQKCDPTDRQGGRSLAERDFGDYFAGRDAGRGAQLNRGVDSGAAPLALLN